MGPRDRREKIGSVSSLERTEDSRLGHHSDPSLFDHPPGETTVNVVKSSTVE